MRVGKAPILHDDASSFHCVQTAWILCGFLLPLHESPHYIPNLIHKSFSRLNFNLIFSIAPISGTIPGTSFYRHRTQAMKKYAPIMPGK